MSEPAATAPTTVQLELGRSWVEAPVHEDVGADVWGRQMISEALAARGSYPSAERQAVYAAMYADLLRMLREGADYDDMKLVSAYFYVPDEDLFYSAMVKLVALALPPGSTLDDAVQAVVAAPEERYGEAIVSELETASGPCLRVQQLVLEPQAGGDSGVLSCLLYVWPPAQDGVVLTLACSFGTPVDGALYEAALDGFAASLESRGDA